jgi:S1-C subfamily serine protease
MNSLLKNSAIVLSAAVIGGGVVAVSTDHDSTTKNIVVTQSSDSGSQPAAVVSGVGLSPRQIYQQDAPGVVVVKSTATQTTQNEFGQPQSQTESALGSGFLIDRQGHILTNGHVVAGTNPQVTVGFVNSSGQDVTYPAKVLGIDTATDVAVLEPTKPLPSSVMDPLPLGSVDNVNVGDSVVAIGNPLGEERTITSGIVSALNRSIESPSGQPIAEAIQTDAAINHGNSGGPLIDSSGKVIGITSQILTGSDSEEAGSIGIGFAIPIDTARTVAQQIIATGHASHPYIGVKGVALTPSLAQALHISSQHGFLVESVDANSPAAAAGLVAGTTPAKLSGANIKLGGDIITAIDGKQIAAFSDLYDTIASHKAGDTVTLTVTRDGQTRNVQVTLADRPN